MNAQLVIVEDEKHVADAFKSRIRLKEKISVDNYEATHIETIDELENLTPSEGVIRQFVVDLSHYGETNAGYRALKIIAELYPDTKPIVYTAFPRELSRCVNEYKIEKEHFIKKRRLREELAKIEALLEERFKLDIKVFRKKNKTRVLKPETQESRKGSTSQNQIELTTRHSKLLKNSYEELSGLPPHVNSYLAKCLLYYNKKGFHYFPLDNYIWEVEINKINSLELEETARKDKLVVNTTTGSDSMVAGLNIFTNKDKVLNGYSHDSDLKTLSFITDYYLKLKSNLETINLFLIETFISHQLANDFTENGGQIQVILPILKKLTPEIGQAEYMVKVWEFLTLNATGNGKKTNKILAEFYQHGLTPIKDIFYCQVVRHVRWKKCQVRMASVEDLTKSFYQIFKLKELAKADVSNEDACFRLIIYETEKNPFIEPITLETYNEKLDD